MRRRREPIDPPFVRLPKVRRRGTLFEETLPATESEQYVKSQIEREVQARSATTDDTVLDTNKNLLETSKFSDLKFLVGPHKVEIQAHKLILMSRSSVFAAMLDNADRWVEAQAGVIQMSDVDPTDAFKATMSNVMQILDLAVKYHIPALVQKCAKLAKKNINIDNCICIYECARMYAHALGNSRLENAALNFIVKVDLLRHPSFLTMKKETLFQLISSNELLIGEVEFFKAILKWAVEECGRQKMDPITQNQRIVLTGIAEIFKFTNMTAKDFTLNVAVVGILTAEENKIYRQICVGEQDIQIYREIMPRFRFNRDWENWDASNDL